jgi:putative FmdB family regulatory protein
MPTYSYRCTECGTAFDIQQAFTDDSLTVCPNCGGKLRKLFSAVGVSFSGSGFYRNDSRASENKAREKKESVAASSSSDSGSSSAPSSSDSKAAASAPAASSAPAKASGSPAPKKAAAPSKKE